MMPAIPAIAWGKLLGSRWLHYGVLLLALALAWLRGDAWEAAAGRWKNAHAAQESAMVASQQAAKAKAVAARLAAENQSAALARRADHADETIAQLRSAADRFAAARRLRTPPAGGAPGGPRAAGEGDPAPDRDGPGADAVVLTRPEYDDFVASALRLERVRRWGQSLIAEGLALPEAEFGHEPDSSEGE